MNAAHSSSITWRLARWLRAGYPELAPPTGYCPAIALLAPTVPPTPTAVLFDDGRPLRH